MQEIMLLALCLTSYLFIFILWIALCSPHDQQLDLLFSKDESLHLHVQPTSIFFTAWTNQFSARNNTLMHRACNKTSCTCGMGFLSFSFKTNLLKAEINQRRSSHLKELNDPWSQLLCFWARWNSRSTCSQARETQREFTSTVLVEQYLGAGSLLGTTINDPGVGPEKIKKIIQGPSQREWKHPTVDAPLVSHTIFVNCTISFKFSFSGHHVSIVSIWH